MHDRNKLCLKLGLYIAGDVFHGRGDRVVGYERGGYDNAEAFHLEVGLVQGFKGAAVIKVMIKWDGKVGV